MLENQTEGTIAAAIFRWIVIRPWRVLAAGLVVVLTAALFLPHLEKDTRSDAFLAVDNPAVVYRDLVKKQFGLSDPLVIVAVADGDDGVYTQEILKLVENLTGKVSALPNVDSARVVSLATEKNITSSAEGIEITPFLQPFPDTRSAALAVRQQVEAFPLYAGGLVSKDGHATVLVAEMLDEDLAESSYRNILMLLEQSPLPSGVTLHVAGEGAVSGYLGSYIDVDAQRLVPFAAVIITLIIFLAFGSFSAALLCDLVMVSTVVITLGVMSAQGVPFYIITAALPVILIGISVADAIHIYSHYFDLQMQQPDQSCEDLVSATMLSIWRPVTLTSLTTIAGFLGLYYAAYMPPFQYFGLFAAFGVAVAWLYSLVILPAAMVLAKPQRAERKAGASAGSAVLMAHIGRFTLRHPGAIILMFLLVLIAGSYAALQLKVDDEPIGVFHPDESIAIADRIINQYTDGSNTLDIVVETQASEELFDPVKLQKIEALQNYAANLPYVGTSSSIVDYLKQMNRAMNDGQAEFYKLPETREMVAQYFLIYAALSDPTDFEEEVDYDYRMANIRIQLTAGGYQDTLPAIESLESYISENFDDDEMTVTVSGRVNLNYRWIKELANSHFAGVAIALILVWMASALLFRSELAGLYTLVPVVGSVLGVYAVMVLTGITLGMGTSMFAAIAIGLGIDFSIHTLDRMRVLVAKHEGDLAAAFVDYYPTTGRASLFNCLAIACGFGILLVSKIMSLISFGGIVMLSIGVSFLASITLLPALLWRFKPGFLFATKGGVSRFTTPRVLFFTAVLMTLALQAIPSVAAAEALSADDIVRNVNAAGQSEFITRNLTMEMVDRRGSARLRETISYRRKFEDMEKTVIFYLSPANVRDTAFLTWDYNSADREDDQWLYLPALRKVRRISAGNRGDYFLGTDFTYDDIKQDGKLSTSDFNYSLVTSDAEGVPDSVDFEHYVLESVPKADKIAKELGYSRTVITVDARNWVVLGVEFWDLKGVYLKTLQVRDIREVQGIWTRQVLAMENHQTGHKTEIMLSNVDYKTPLKSNLFTKQSLTRGH